MLIDNNNPVMEAIMKQVMSVLPSDVGDASDVTEFNLFPHMLPDALAGHLGGRECSNLGTMFYRKAFLLDDEHALIGTLEGSNTVCCADPPQPTSSMPMIAEALLEHPELPKVTAIVTASRIDALADPAEETEPEHELQVHVYPVDQESIRDMCARAVGREGLRQSLENLVNIPGHHGVAEITIIKLDVGSRHERGF